MEARPTGRRAVEDATERDDEPVAAGAAVSTAPRVTGGRVATNIPPRPRKKGKRR
jgi:hypothetical protein